MNQDRSFNFSWVVENAIAGLGMPSVFADRFTQRHELKRLTRIGIKALLTLTEKCFAEDIIEEMGLRCLFVPIVNLCAPTLQDVDACMTFIDECYEQNIPVAVHCWAGMGRTGTILACWLVHHGWTASKAIDDIRFIREGSIENKEQEQAVHDYYHKVRLPIETAD